jgi:uncharacterized tellurite resistance protein B-like protein
MPRLLFPTGAALRCVETGTFSCPMCCAAREYGRVEVAREVRLFAIRVSLGIYGEYVECASCQSTFRPEVLAYDGGEGSEAVRSEYQRALLRVLCLLVVTDGRVHDVELQTVQRVYEAVTGSRLGREQVRAEAAEVAAEPTTAASYLSRVVGCLNERGKEQILRGAAMVSGSDGQLHPSEAEMIRRLGAVMKTDPARIEAVLRDFA